MNLEKYKVRLYQGDNPKKCHEPLDIPRVKYLCKLFEAVMKFKRTLTVCRKIALSELVTNFEDRLISRNLENMKILYTENDDVKITWTNPISYKDKWKIVDSIIIH